MIIDDQAVVMLHSNAEGPKVAKKLEHRTLNPEFCGKMSSLTVSCRCFGHAIPSWILSCAYVCIANLSTSCMPAKILKKSEIHFIIYFIGPENPLRIMVI